MGKQSGLGDQLYVGGYDVSNDTQQLNRIGGGPAALDLTGIDKSAYERKGGHFDGAIDWTSFLNDAALHEHAALSGLPRTDVVISYGRSSVLGAPGAGIVAKQIGYDGTRDTDGMLLFALQSMSNGFSIEWGRQLTAGKRTDTAATNGTGVDFGVPTAGSTAFGAQFYLQVFSFTGVSATIKVQESSDNGADVYADVTGGSFGAISSAPQAVRIATATNLTVERFLRVITTGTFSECTFAVIGIRNDTAVELL